MSARLADLLYPIADAVQVNLKYRNDTSRISGKRMVKLELGKKMEITATLDAVSSFVNVKEQQAGVLFHVRGQMYLLVVHNSRGKMLSSYVISSKSLGMRRVELVDYLPKMCNIKTAVNKLSQGIKKSYCRNAKSNKWSVLELPQGMGT